MTALLEHVASARLALMALCGDLVVAIDAMAIHTIRTVTETTARAVERGIWVLDIDGELVPGWDLGELLALGPCELAWVVVDLPGGLHRVGLRLGRCVMVQPLPVCRAIPRGIFTDRAASIAAGFSTAEIPELTGYVSGVVIDLAHVLADRELARIDELGRGRHDPTA
jgi:hypothetical protein